MLRTTDGWSVKDTLEAFDTRVEMADIKDYYKVRFEFAIDGATSEYKGHEGELVFVDVRNTIITLTCCENQIKLPNMCRSTLPAMIEKAAEILLFEKGIKVE